MLLSALGGIVALALVLLWDLARVLDESCGRAGLADGMDPGDARVQ